MLKKVSYVPPRVSRPKPLLAITKTGRINLNRHFVAKFGLGRDLAANLYWNEEEGRLALLFTAKGTPGAFPFLFVPNGQTAYVLSKQLFQVNGLDPHEYVGWYDFEVVRPDQLGVAGAEGDIFVIDLGVGRRGISNRHRPGRILAG